MKRDDLFDAFDEIRCSKAFSERMEAALQAPYAATHGTEIVSDVAVTKYSRIRRAGMIAACIAVILLGGTGLMALQHRIPSQPDEPPVQETGTTAILQQPLATETTSRTTEQTETAPPEIIGTESTCTTTTAQTTAFTQTAAATTLLTETTTTNTTAALPAESSDKSTISTTTTILPNRQTTTSRTTTTTAEQSSTSTETTTKVTDTLPITTPEIHIDYGTKLEYDNTPMTVGETRVVRYYHPAYPDTPVGSHSFGEISANITCRLDEANGVVYVTAVSAGSAKFYIAAEGCAFGAYAYFTIE